MKNLTKNLILVTLLFGIPSLSHAQVSKKEAVIISAGYGMPNLDALMYKIGSGDGDLNYSSVGPLHAKVEVKATKVLGIGLSVNYFNYKTPTTDNSFISYNNSSEPTTFTRKKTSIKFNIRTNLHYVRTSGFDLYAGFGLGYGASSHTELSANGINTVSKKNPFPMGFEVTQGVRMTLTNNFAMYAEVGMAQSFMQIGACYRFHGSGE